MNKSKKNTSPSFFSEIYGAYFRTVRKILGSSTLTRRQINKITEENAFRDSILYIPSSIIPNSEGKSDWGLLKSATDGEYKSLVKSTPTPMTVLQKRWLKSKLSDSRIKLFLDDEGFDKLTRLLEDVEPLYSDDTFFCFDKFSDGDCYESESYRSSFRLLLSAIKAKSLVHIDYTSAKGNVISAEYLPLRFEYSDKNDKLRLICSKAYISDNKAYGFDSCIRMNLSRIKSVSLSSCSCTSEPDISLSDKRSYVYLEVTHDRNGIERFMVEFAPFEKRTVYNAEADSCCVMLMYPTDDESEILIRLLSFGGVIRVLNPKDVNPSDFLTEELDINSMTASHIADDIAKRVKAQQMLLSKCL